MSNGLKREKKSSTYGPKGNIIKAGLFSKLLRKREIEKKIS
jgi:hypothetical protein